MFCGGPKVHGRGRAGGETEMFKLQLLIPGDSQPLLMGKELVPDLIPYSNA